MAPVWLRSWLLLLWYADLTRVVLPGLIGFLTKSNEGQTLCSFPPALFLLSFPRKDGEPYKIKDDRKNEFCGRRFMSCVR